MASEAHVMDGDCLFSRRRDDEEDEDESCVSEREREEDS